MEPTEEQYNLAISELMKENQRLNSKKSNIFPIIIIIILSGTLYLAWNFPSWLINKASEVADTAIKASQEIVESVIPKEVFANLKMSYGINNDNCLNSSTVQDFCSCISNYTPAVGVKLVVNISGVGTFINNGGRLKTAGCFPVNPDIGMGCYMYSYIQNQGSHIVIPGNACFLKDYPIFKLK